MARTLFHLNERSFLQLAIAVFGLVPVCAGSVGVMLGQELLDPQHLQINLDSHFRYLSGILLAIGLAFWHAIPHIESMTTRCRVLTFLVIIGGIARGWALLDAGVPSMPMVLALGMELAVTPLLCLWQGRIAKQYGPVA